MIQFLCSQCKALIQVDDFAAGKAGRCPQCQLKLLVPRESDPAAVEMAQTAPPPPAPPAQPPMRQPPFPAQPAAPQFPDPVAPQFPDAPAPAANPLSQQPVDPFAQQPVDPFAQQPVQSPAAGMPSGDVPFMQPPSPAATPMARRVKRRRKKQGGMFVPVLFGGILSAGIFYYFWFNRPTLTGELQGVALEKVELQPSYLTPNVAPGISKDTYIEVRDILADAPFRVVSQLMEAEFRGTSRGISIQITEGDKTQLVKVSLDHGSYLQEYYGEHEKELRKPLEEEFIPAAKTFFEIIELGLDGISEKQKTKMRDEVGLNSMLSGLGYNIIANTGKALYRCVAEVEGDLYFLLPKGTKTFTVEPRRFKNSDGENKILNLPNEFRYVVKVRSAKKE